LTKEEQTNTTKLNVLKTVSAQEPKKGAWLHVHLYQNCSVSRRGYHQTLARKFAKYCPLFKILSSTDLPVNLHVPPHLKHVATLPCEISAFKNLHRN